MITETLINNYHADIYIGLKDILSDYQYTLLDVERECRKYCDEVGLSIFAETGTLIYRNGWELATIVRILQYDNGTRSNNDLFNSAVNLAKFLMMRLRQYQCVVRSNERAIRLVKTDLIN